ncbi:MAG TPA: superoxide dismutase [Caulobacteraceae bacterium]|nr:superoxide dismutase [Caulobacteraceae bacterium]
MIRLPDLPYSHDALSPVLSEATMRTHHGKHHAKYVEVVNALTAAEGGPAESLEEIVRRAALDGDRKLFNNAAQAWNHAFFWTCMTPSPRPPQGELARAIATSFGDHGALRDAFIAEGTAHFGSGWVWLAAEDGRLSVFSTHDADTVVTRNVTPLLVCDLWEHAYYLDHRNDRAGFLGAWWDRLANWALAERQFTARDGETWKHPDALSDHEVLERALEEAHELLERSREPGGAQDRRLAELMALITGYKDGPTPPPHIPDELDRRIDVAKRRIAAHVQANPDHWSPMVGGDLRPQHQH